MKTLLTSIRTALQTSIADVRSRDIFLTPDADMLPESAKLPCIGIKDGKLTRTELMGGCTEKNMPVEISVYVRLLRDDEAIEALLDICESAVDALADNLLNDYVKEVSVGDETPIHLLFQKDAMIIRKTIFMQYVREE